MQTHGIETGVLGAKRTSYTARTNPREILKGVMEANPHASVSELCALFEKEVRQDEGAVSVVIEYYVSNQSRYLRQPSTASQVIAAKERRQTIVAVKQKIVAKVERKARMLLLEMILPNGKLLRDCTGKECAALAKKMGGWLAKVAEKVKPSQIIGEVLSEADVRRLYER